MSERAGKSAEKGSVEQQDVRVNERSQAQFSGSHDSILALQRAAGNRAVTDLLRRSSGRPLDADTREEMEAKFGEDFRDVRVHAGGAAAASASVLNANAFTAGQDIAFGEGRYSPRTSGGKTLLAHELAHVVQQRRGGPTPRTFEPGSAAERDAAAASGEFAGAGPVSVSSATGTGVAREEAQELPWWKNRLNPLYQRALEVLPKGAAEELRQANAAAKEFVTGTGVSDESLNKAVQVADPVLKPVADYLSVKSDTPTAKADDAPATPIQNENAPELPQLGAGLSWHPGAQPTESETKLQAAQPGPVKLSPVENQEPGLAEDLRNRGIGPPAPPRAKPAPPRVQTDEEKYPTVVRMRPQPAQETRELSPEEERQMEDFKYQLGSDAVHLSRREFTKKYGVSQAESESLSKYLSAQGYFPDNPEQLEMDYAGRTGTAENLARREMAGRIGALGQSTTTGGIAAAYAGAAGGTAEDMQNAGQLGNVVEGLGTLAIGGRGGSSRAENAAGPPSSTEAQHGAPLELPPEQRAPMERNVPDLGSGAVPEPSWTGGSERRSALPDEGVIHLDFSPQETEQAPEVSDSSKAGVDPASVEKANPPAQQDADQKRAPGPELPLVNVPGGTAKSANDVVPPKAMSTGEAAEAKALEQYRPGATLLGEKAGGYDAHIGGQKTITSEKQEKDSAGNPIVVRQVVISAPDDAIQIKTITQLDKYGQPSQKPLPELVARNVKDALKKAYNQPVTQSRALTPLPGTNIYERTNIEAPKKITIIVQVPGPVTQEMSDAASRILEKDTRTAELPPIEVIVQTEKQTKK